MGLFSWLGGAARKAQRKLTGANRRFQVSEHELIEILGSEEKIFKKVWDNAAEDKKKLRKELTMQGDVISALETIRAEITKLEAVVTKVEAEQASINKVGEPKPAGNFVLSHLERKVGITAAEVREGLRLAYDVERKLRVLKSFTQKLTQEKELERTNAKRLTRLIEKLDVRMKGARTILVGEERIAKIERLDAEAA